MKLTKIRRNSKQDYPDLPEHWLQSWLLYVLDQPVNFLITSPDYQLTEEQHSKFVQGLEQMQAGKPLAYLIGKQDFWSLEFMVNEHTLIPRPDTEVLVEQVLEWIKNNNHINNMPANKLLDLGTGSGCIAISLAYELAKRQNQQNKSNKIAEWSITAVDKSAPALAVAQRNAGYNLTKEQQIQFVQSDWYDSLPKDDKYSVIVSNPPYIDKTDRHLVQLQAEPITALISEQQGLADIELIVRQAPKYLLARGLCAVEHGYNQGQSVRSLFMKYGFNHVRTIQDYSGNDRVTLGCT